MYFLFKNRNEQENYKTTLQKCQGIQKKTKQLQL